MQRLLALRCLIGYLELNSYSSVVVAVVAAAAAASASDVSVFERCNRSLAASLSIIFSCLNQLSETKAVKGPKRSN